MDGIDSKLPNSDPKSYFRDGYAFENSVEAFLTDTFAGKNEKEINDAMDRIKEETKDIPMGTTTEKALNQCTEFLKEKGIETEDNSQAIDICTLRVLKMMPGMFDLQKGDSKKIEFLTVVLSQLVQLYILPEQSNILRARATGSNGVNSLDQHMRINGAPMNIQRHVSDEEMGIVLAYVRFLVKGYMDVQDF